MNVKERKVFSLKSFKGLDTENKPLKVAPYRASNGQNFIIDSEILKTRPAFKHYKEPKLGLSADDYIIDWYEYGNINLYVTKKHIYIDYNGIIFNESMDNSNFIHQVFATFDFTGLKPYFKEEKNCLFIFCLNNIFVFSMFGDKYVLYELRGKPNNPFTEDDINYKPYDELPTPYEPTLFIGNNSYDDINLLSNASKYSLFATIDVKENGGKILYTLPTNYDPAKHGTFEYSITFYKDKFKGLSILPVYLGIQGEDFDSFVDHGEVLAINAPEIQNIFFPKNDFEYYGTPDAPELISGIVDLDKTTFFNFKIKDSNQKVFDFLVSYIKTNTINSNCIYTFLLPVEYTAIYKDKTTDFITQKNVKKEYVKVYVELKKDEIVEFDIADTASFISEEIYEDPTLSVVPYPDSPFLPSSYNATLYFNETFLPSWTIFKADAQNLIYNKKDTYENGYKVLIIGRCSTTRMSSPQQKEVLDNTSEWVASDVLIDSPTFPDYPAFDSAGIPSQNIITVGTITTPAEIIDFNDLTLKNTIVNTIISNMSTLYGEVGRGFAKVQIQTASFAKKQSVVVGFYYEKGNYKPYNIKQTMAYVGTIVKQAVAIFDNVSEFAFNDENNVFELKVKDYFFDFNNEPSIDIRVKFQYNPDYDLIANSRFGITFGSENRLFLAGNENYPNIDHYNVSNDLLGNNVKNQSYELTYFPSKNYRVIGGKGKINGYAVATDTTLYIAKDEYRNDEKLFIRQRKMDDNGVVGYNEFKTSISKTPLNNRCFVRFYNDILMLTKDGLYAVEIGQNVLTDERLLKLRSGFINQDLINTVSDKDVFILENNYYLYIFVGNIVYVADSRYIDINKNSEVANTSYEIVKWSLPFDYKTGHFVGQELVMLDSYGRHLYNLVRNENNDDKVSRHDLSVQVFDVTNVKHKAKSAFLVTQGLEYLLANPKGVSFTFDSGYKVVAVQTIDYGIAGNSIVINDYTQFASLKDGDTLYFKDINNIFYPFTIEISNDKINFPVDIQGDKATIYQKIANVPLYISLIYDYMFAGVYQTVLRLSPYAVENIEIVEKIVTEMDDEYLTRLDEKLAKNHDYVFTIPGMLNCLVNEEKPIELLWYSAVTDMGNNLMEKTMFKANVYAIKQAKDNVLFFGYKTMRGLKTFNSAKETAFTSPFGFDDINFNSISLTTFNEFGMSLPIKENNFLYIQFMIKGYGNVELSAIEIIYKLNRQLKTIG